MQLLQAVMVSQKNFPRQKVQNIDTQYPYALTKWQGEELVMHWQKIFNLPAISLRFLIVMEIDLEQPVLMELYLEYSLRKDLQVNL